MIDGSLKPTLVGKIFALQLEGWNPHPQIWRGEGIGPFIYLFILCYFLRERESVKCLNRLLVILSVSHHQFQGEEETKTLVAIF